MLNSDIRDRSWQSRVFLICDSFRIWSRRVCIKESLKRGSMLPFVEYAQKKKFSCIILNPNDSTPYSDQYVNTIVNCIQWKIIATLYGTSMSAVAQLSSQQQLLTQQEGTVQLKSLNKIVSIRNNFLEQEFKKRVKALVFTDAYYHSMFESMNFQEKRDIREIGIHFKAY